VLRVVLDANVFVSALLRPASPPGEILRILFRDRAFELITSPPIIDELRRSLRYRRVRKYLAASESEIEAWVSAVELISDSVEGRLQVAAVDADPDDDKYFSAALEGRADCIVSGDHRLLALVEFQGVPIIRPRALLERL